MASIQANWEDEENNRSVELEVSYQLAAGRVEISSVTPTRVSFFDEGSKTPGRSIGVWTETGRAMLVTQAVAAGRIREIESQLATDGTVELAGAQGTLTAADEPCPLSA
jgi:hypothetical protein